MDWYKRYIGDYAGDTAHLTMIEDGAYGRLIDHYYKKERPLPLDEGELFRIARAFEGSEKEAVRRVIREFFVKKKSGFHKERINKEILKYQGRSEINRRNASKSHSESLTESHSEQGSNTRNQKPEARKNSSQRKFSDEDMETAKWIFDKLLLLNPKHKKPNLETWSNSIRLMKERDSRSDAEIRKVFEWANQDPFWQTNILSPSKLRDKFDQLTLAATRGGVKLTTETDPFKLAVTKAKELNLEPFKGYPHETQGEFMERVNQ